MALTWNNFSNGDVLLSIRNAINTFNTAATSLINSIDTQVTTNTSNIASNTSQISTNSTNIATNTSDIGDIQTELATAPSMVSISSSTRTTQTLVADTPERLEWMSAATVDAGSADISYVLLNHQFTVLTQAKYKLTGVVSFKAPINDTVDVELYIDNVATGFVSSAIGRGDDSVLTLTYAAVAEFNVNDEIDLYVTSTGTEVTVQSANVTLEKTPY